MRIFRSLIWCFLALFAGDLVLTQLTSSLVGSPARPGFQLSQIARLSIITPAHAAVVSSIQVQGSSRVDPETVKTYVTIVPGEAFGQTDIDQSIKSLFSTGLFSDVSIRQSGSVLIVTVNENDVISEISIEGNRRVDDETIKGVLQSRERTALLTTIVQGDVQRILEAYRRRGRYQATVEAKTIRLDTNRVNLVFEVNEGRETSVARISFIGNRAFSDGRLREVIETQQSGLLGFIRQFDIYDPDRLEADQDRLRSFYFDNGYADFRIISAVADFDRERNVFFLTFTLEEGERYRFGDVAVQSSLTNVDTEELRNSLQSRPGRVYNASRVERSIEAMVADVAEEGYAFAQIRPRGDRNLEDNTIDITYYVDEGPRVFVERIEVRGNTKTREYVVRREFDFAEGDAFNRVLLDKAERRLNDLGFFERVAITTQPGSAPDRVVIVVNVIDKATGEIGFGAGLSTSDGLVGDISLTERNFLGRGQFVRAAVGVGDEKQSYNFTFTEPYFLGRRIALSTRLYRTQSGATGSANYDLDDTGGRVGLGVPLNEELSLEVFYRASSRNVELTYDTGEDSNSDGTDDGLQDNNGNGTIDGREDLDGDGVADGIEDISRAIREIEGRTFTSLLGYSLAFDTRDSKRNPKDGYYAELTQEFAGIGGDVSYIRTRLNASAYRELVPSQGILGIARARYGNIQGLGDDVQLIDQFLGGPAYVRGFKSAGFGPRDGSTGDAVGARHILSGTAEVQAPMPFFPPDLGFSVAAFVDAGVAFDTDPGSSSGVTVVADDMGLIRSSIGGSVIWVSPFGPVRADFAHAISKSTFDETQFFRVGGSTRF